MKKTVVFYFLICLPCLLFFDLKSMHEKEKLTAQLETLKKQLQEQYSIKLDTLIKNLKNTWLKEAKKITGKDTEKEINTIPIDTFNRDYRTTINEQTANTKQHLLEDFFNNTPIGAFNIQNEKGQTILHIMIHEGYHDYVKYLLDNGGDITIVNRNGNSSLHLAVNNIDMINLLLQKANTLQFPLNFINQQNAFGNTALLLAVENNNTAVVQALLEAGANPNISNNDGFTALHQAVLQEQPSEKTKEIITILLSYGADPNIITTSRLVSGKERQNKSPRELAEKIMNDIETTKKSIGINPKEEKNLVTIKNTIAEMLRYAKKPGQLTIKATPKKRIFWQDLTPTQPKKQNEAALLQSLQELTQKLHALTLRLSA